MNITFTIHNYMAQALTQKLGRLVSPVEITMAIKEQPVDGSTLFSATVDGVSHDITIPKRDFGQFYPYNTSVRIGNGAIGTEASLFEALKEHCGFTFTASDWETMDPWRTQWCAVVAKDENKMWFGAGEFLRDTTFEKQPGMYWRLSHLLSEGSRPVTPTNISIVDAGGKKWGVPNGWADFSDEMLIYTKCTLQFEIAMTPTAGLFLSQAKTGLPTGSLSIDASGYLVLNGLKTTSIVIDESPQVITITRNGDVWNVYENAVLKDSFQAAVGDIGAWRYFGGPARPTQQLRNLCYWFNYVATQEQVTANYQNALKL